MKNKKQNMTDIMPKKLFGIIAMTVSYLVMTASDAAAHNCGDGIGGVLCSVLESSSEVPGLISGLSYLFGLCMGVWAIAKFYEHVQNPQQVSVWEGIKRTFAAGCFFALPMIIMVAYETMIGGDETPLDVTGWSGGDLTDGGLDEMLVALMTDTMGPVHILIKGFCYLAGLVLVMIVISRQIKSMQDGPRGPGGFGTIMTLLVAGALFSVEIMMAAWSESMFMNSGEVVTQSVLSFDAGLSAEEENRVLAVISAAVAFVMILGMISFVRGLFIIRGVSEGDQQASLMSGMTHLFGGALAINIGPVLNAIQTTLGLTGTGIEFS